MKLLTRDQDALIRMQTRLVISSRLVSKPITGGLELFRQTAAEEHLAVLANYPTPQAAMVASAQHITEVLRQAKHSIRLRCRHDFRAAAPATLQADAVTTRTKSRLMLALVSQLLPLLEQIKQYDKEIRTLFGA